MRELDRASEHVHSGEAQEGRQRCRAKNKPQADEKVHARISSSCHTVARARTERAEKRTIA